MSNITTILSNIVVILLTKNSMDNGIHDYLEKGKKKKRKEDNSLIITSKRRLSLDPHYVGKLYGGRSSYL